MKFCELSVLILIALLTLMEYSLPAPVLPLEMNRRHISQTSTGVAMAAYSVGFIIGSVFPTDWLYTNLGRRKTTQCGLLILSFALLLYSLSYFIPDSETGLFLWASILLRIIQGLGTGIMMTALMSLIILTHPEQSGKAISARVCGSSLGMSLGGVLGGVLYHLLGYFGVFLAFTITTLFTSLLLLIFKEIKGYNRAGSVESQLTLCQYLSVRRSTLTQLCNGVCEIVLFTMEPTLAVQLKKEYHFSPSTIGLFFFLFFGGGVITMTSTLFIPQSWDKRKFILPALIMMAFLSFLIGPSAILHLPSSPIIRGLGIFLTGGARGICFALCPADALTGAQIVYPDEEAKVSDFVSQVNMFLFGLTTLCFPIIGSALVQQFGFISAFDIVGFILLANSTVYLVSTLIDWNQERKHDLSFEEEKVLIEQEID